MVPLSRILVAIPTFRRPEGLERLLEALAAERVDARIDVAVFDNDPAGGQGLVVTADRVRRGYPFPLSAAGIADRGLCHVRNAMVEHALADEAYDHLVMIDDDEWPAPGWLAALLAVHEATGADVTGGPNRPMFPVETPDWIRACPLYRADDEPAGPIDMVWGTCNVVFRLSSLRALPPGPVFDMRYNLMGGEDVEAFTRLKTLGFRYAWAPEAVVLEDVPPARTRLGWIVRRAFRIGATGMAVQLAWRYGRWGWPRALGFSLVQFFAYGAKLVVHAGDVERRMNNFCNLVRVTGKLASLFGFSYREYG